MEAQNQILLDDKVGGKGKFFATRFLQPGLVKYSFGVCLLEKETIDKFIYNFVGCPVIINHKDVTAESAKEDRVGVISRVWFNECDGWYHGEGIIFEQEALDLIDQGYNVSCQYEITEYSSTGGLHNGNNYDKTILNGRPEHLAIVENPRYESAMIAVNAMEIEKMEAINADKKEFVTVGEGESAHAIPVDYLENDKSSEDLRKEFRKYQDEIFEKHQKGILTKEEHAEYLKRSEEFNKAYAKIKTKENNKAYKHLKDKAATNEIMQAINEEGRWITVKGTHVFVKKGQGVEDAMKETFDKSSSKKTIKPDKKEVLERIDEIQRESGWYGDKELNRIKTHLQRTADWDEDTILELSTQLGEYEDKYKKTIKKFDDNKKDKKDLEGKYEREDVEFDEEQLKKDIKAAKDMGHESVEDIAEFLGLDEDEVRETMTSEEELEFEEAPEELQKEDSEDYKDLEKQRDGLQKQIQGLKKRLEGAITKDAKEAIQRGIDARKKRIGKLEDAMIKERKKAKNSIIQAINEIKGLDMFKNLFKKKEKQMDREEIKSIMMECLTELTASNEAPATEEEDKKEEEVVENKCKNEDAEPDYKKLYEDLKAKMEAGNKCKNEEDKEDVAEDKAKNSIDEQMALFSKEVEAEKSTYLTREDAIELGNQLF